MEWGLAHIDSRELTEWQIVRQIHDEEAEAAERARDDKINFEVALELVRDERGVAAGEDSEETSEDDG